MDTTNDGRLGDRTLLPGTEGLKHSDPSGSLADYEASTNMLKQQQQPLQLQQQSVAKVRGRPEHPPAKNKDARKHISRLRHLGFQNFNEIDIEYWEPSKPGEDRSQHMARRQRECLAMNSLLDRMEAKVLVEKALNSRHKTANDNDKETSIIETQEEELLNLKTTNEALQERYKQLENRLEVEYQLKVTAERKTQELMEQLQSPFHSNEVTDQRQLMMEEKLNQQTSKLDELMATVDDQAKKLDELTGKYGRLYQRYKKMGEENNTLKSSLEATLEENKSLREALGTQETDEVVSLRKELEKSSVKNKELEKELQQLALAEAGHSNANVTNQNLMQMLEELLDKKLDEKLQKLVKPQKQSRNLQLKFNNSEYNNLDMGSCTDTPDIELDGFTFRKKNRRRNRVNSIDTVDTMDSAVRNHKKPTYSQVTRDKKRGQIPDARTDPREMQNKQPNGGTKTSGQKFRKVLILPEADKKVVQSMREKNLKARELGISNVVEFPSGAALLLIQEKNANETMKKIEDAGLQQKPQPTLREKNSFKVHDIPVGNTEEDIEEEIHNILGIKPDKVILLHYRDEKKKNVRLGVIEGSKSLADAVKNKKFLFIDYKHCRIDNKPNLMRCKTCKLLGHTKNNCGGIPAAVLLDYQQQQGKACLDCLAYNKRMALAGFSTGRYRFTDHELDSRECPTKKAFLKKAYAGPVRGALVANITNDEQEPE